MAINYRTCGGKSKFNTGKSRCPVPRGKIKMLIFVESGIKLPKVLTPESIEIACHADEPNRIYPIKTVEEYAPSGGEAQTSQQGYGPNKVTGYSAKTDAFTLDDPDMALKANIVSAKNKKLDVYLVNDSNIIFGDRDNDGSLKGIPLSGISVGGQDYDSSGQVANLIVNVMYKDIEKHWELEDVIQVDFDIVSAAQGLTEVNLVKLDEENNYKIIEVNGSLDVTSYFGSIIGENATTILGSGITTASYADGIITVTGGTPSLAKPSILQKVGILGIEEADAEYVTDGSEDELIDPDA